MRLLALDAAAGIEHQRGLRAADQLGQRDGEAEARMEAEDGEVRAEARFGAGDAEIGYQREPEPAADGRAVDCADDRFFRAKEAHRLDVQVPDRARVRLALH